MADLLSAILFSNARLVLLIMLSGYVAQKAFLNSRHDNVGHNLHGYDHCNAGHLQLAPLARLQGCNHKQDCTHSQDMTANKQTMPLGVRVQELIQIVFRHVNSLLVDCLIRRPSSESLILHEVQPAIERLAGLICTRCGIAVRRVE